MAIVDVNDAIVGYGDFEDIRGKILDASFTAADCLAIDIEASIPNLCRDLGIKMVLFHRIPELGLEDEGNGFDRQIEIDPRWMPLLVFFG